MSVPTDEAPLETSEGNDRFQTTQWQMIHRARSETDDSVHHLDRLLRRYLPALSGFLSRRYHFDKSTNEDLLQSFIVARILHGRLLELADPERGRFRTILLTALTNHVRMESRKLQAKKRIPVNGLLSIDTVKEEHFEPNRQSPDEALFGPRLDRQIIEEAVRKFRRHCDRRGKLTMWEVFENRLLKPMLNNESPESYERLTTRLRLTSQTQATNLLMTAKRSFIRTLQEVVNEFALNTTDAELELSALRRICGLDSNGSE